MRQLLELNTVDGGAFDIMPDFVLFIEAFDELKNDNYPDAKVFVLAMDGPQIVHQIATDDFDEVSAVVKATAPGDWFEVTNKGGNRCLMRGSQVMSRQSLSEEEGGSVIVLSFNGQFRAVQVNETVQELRDMMNGPEPEGNVVPLIQPGPPVEEDPA